jgi:hypothetical protein
MTYGRDAAKAQTLARRKARQRKTLLAGRDIIRTRRGRN